MSDSSGAASVAVKKLLETYQNMADEEKTLAPKREAAQQKIDQLVDDLAAMTAFDESKVSNEMLAAYAIFEGKVIQRMQAGDMGAQMELSKFDQNLMQGMRDFFKNLAQDQQKQMDIQQAAQDLTKDMQPAKVVKGEQMFEVAFDEPDDDFGKWTMSFVAVEIDDNYQAKLVDKLDYDLHVSMEITPNAGLSDTFNIPGKLFKAGEKFEPFTVTHETKENGPETFLHVKGHVYVKGAYQGDLVGFKPMPLSKQPPMDMNAIMQQMMGGGDPNGPAGPDAP